MSYKNTNILTYDSIKTCSTIVKDAKRNVIFKRILKATLFSQNGVNIIGIALFWPTMLFNLLQKEMFIPNFIVRTSIEKNAKN